MNITIFDPRSGKINRVITAPFGVAQDQVQEGESWVGGHSDDLIHYVDGGLIVNRPTMPGTLNKPQIIVATAEQLADGTADLATISNLPDCIVTFKGQEYPVVDGSFSFTTNIPGIFTVEVEAFPYLPATFTVEAIENES